jgi:hypothetical protein
MTFEQAMHTIVSHLEALQAEYDRLRKRNLDLLYQVNVQKERNDNLLAINNQLRVENVELEKRIEELE